MTPGRRLGLLLLNLGTPDAPRTREVRRYLREFLSDPRVLDVPAVARFLLLHLVILPRRPRQSAAAYRKVWRSDGSPLLAHGRALQAALTEELGPSWSVELGMRYGEPSTAGAVTSLLRRVDRLVVLPLYPHAAASSTGSSLAKLFEVLGERWDVPPIAVVPPFHSEPAFVRAFAEVGRPVLDGARPDHVLFSFHGLPERHVRRSDPTGATCLASETCCDVLGPANAGCYRAQCFATARLLAVEIGLAVGAHSVTFQSRLGRTPWIRPYTDHAVSKLAGQGVKRLVVFCPGFVADCLETLEEIGLRLREQFLAEGGEELALVPSLNAHPSWVTAAAELARRTAGA
jgi:ferrochelatase